MSAEQPNSFKVLEPVLVLGARGMLGTEICRQLAVRGQRFVAGISSDSDEPYRVIDRKGNSTQAETAVINLQSADLEQALSAVGPGCIINCAAYTAVDKAESDYKIAFELNFLSVERLASWTRENQVCLIHISTDYVFGFASRNESTPYSESDQVSPSGIYGLSKYAGEMAVREILPDSSLCIRTSWLHAAKRSNFVETMLRLAEERDELSVVDDQIGSPTYVPDLAEAILLLIENSARGIYNVSSGAAISWYDFAKEIFRQADSDVRLKTQSSEALQRPAPRPAYSALSAEKLKRDVNFKFEWRDGIRRHLLERSAG